MVVEVVVIRKIVKVVLMVEGRVVRLVDEYPGGYIGAGSGSGGGGENGDGDDNDDGDTTGNIK